MVGTWIEQGGRRSKPCGSLIANSSSESIDKVSLARCAFAVSASDQEKYAIAWQLLGELPKGHWPHLLSCSGTGPLLLNVE